MEDFIEDDLTIINIFKKLLSTGDKVWLWQNPEHKGGIRHAHFAVIKRYDILEKYIEVRPIEGHNFRFTPKRPVYLLSDDFKVAFLMKIKKFEPLFIAFETPTKLKVVSDDFKRGLEIVEKENEKKFSHLRSAPRKSASEDQSIGITRETKEGKFQYYFLYDISAGGMGFLSEDPGEFAVGDSLFAHSIDGNSLPRVLKGKVVAIRNMEETGHFKVGVQFISD